MSALAHARRSYLYRVTGALVVYAGLLIGTNWLRGILPDGAWRYVLALLPMSPLVYLAWAAVRYLRGIDELQRRIQLEGLGFAFAAGSVLTFGYGFLQRVGLPALSWFFVWQVYAVMWIIGVVLARRRYGSPDVDR